MFKLVMAVAIATGSAAAVQAATTPAKSLIHIDNPTISAPRQIAGPVKIRFRQASVETLDMMLSPAAANISSSHQIQLADAPTD